MAYMTHITIKLQFIAYCANKCQMKSAQTFI